jgi:type I site-specific restriction-modification system R (restriction) subunit
MDNVDNYNVNRKVSTFGDFCDKIGAEQEELKDVKRSYSKNSERQQFPKNSKFKFNKVTRKMDDLSPEEVDDDINAIEESTENLSDPGEERDINGKQPTICLTKADLQTFMDDCSKGMGIWSDTSYKICNFLGIDPTEGT